MKTCQWCDDAFEAKVNYQIYCSTGCREEATKEKIAERYAQSRRAKMMKKQRFCTSCEKRLSAYNDDPICQACMVDPKEVSRALREIRGIANDKDR